MLQALSNLLSLVSSWKGYLIVTGLILTAIAGYSEYWHHMGAVDCEAAYKKVATTEVKKEEATYAQIDKAVPASRAKRVAWLLMLAKANGIK